MVSFRCGAAEAITAADANANIAAPRSRQSWGGSRRSDSCPAVAGGLAEVHPCGLPLIGTPRQRTIVLRDLGQARARTSVMQLPGHCLDRRVDDVLGRCARWSPARLSPFCALVWTGRRGQESQRRRGTASVRAARRAGGGHHTVLPRSYRPRRCRRATLLVARPSSSARVVAPWAPAWGEVPRSPGRASNCACRVEVADRARPGRRAGETPARDARPRRPRSDPARPGTSQKRRRSRRRSRRRTPHTDTGESGRPNGSMNRVMGPACLGTSPSRASME